MPTRETGGNQKRLKGPSDHTENTPGFQSGAWALSPTIEDLRGAPTVATARGALGADTCVVTWYVIRLAPVAVVFIVNLQERLNGNIRRTSQLTRRPADGNEYFLNKPQDVVLKLNQRRSAKRRPPFCYQTLFLN